MSVSAKQAFAAPPERVGRVIGATPMTGADYLACLDDGRDVYGERVAEVTEHSSFRNTRG